MFFMDVIQNFLVGYYVDDDDNMVRDRRLIARRYLTSWFLPDVLAFLPLDYIVAPSGANNENASTSNAQVLSLRLARLTRLLRVTKLTRLIKLRHFAAKVEDALDLDAVFSRLFRLICQVLLVTHIFSCFWHLIGFNSEDEGISWVIDAGIQDKGFGVRYIYSFYWVVATVCGVGYGDVHATNQDERLFSMAVSVVGASGFGLIIGNLTKIMENWHRETSSRARKLSMIQSFVRKKRLPRALKVRLMRYFRHYIAKTSAFDERELLCEFSLSLRGEILQETYKNTFFRIPAFKRLSAQFVLDMAMFIKPLIVVNGDILAREGCVGTEMFILNTGIIEVRRTPTEDANWIVVLEVLTETGIFGEGSLLQYGPHSNTYRSKATSDLFTLPKEDFDRLIEEFPDAEHELLEYHQERNSMHDHVFEQTLARYRMFVASQNNDPVSGVAGLENLYPTLTIMIDGVLQSYRSLPLPVLQALDLQLSMGVSVFNSATEKAHMIRLLSQDTSSNDAMSLWQRVKWKLLTPINPYHNAKFAWDVVAAILLVYCAIAVPYEVAFLGDEGTTLSSDMDIIVEIVFGIDIVVNLRTAVVVDLPGEVTTMTTTGYGDTPPENVAEIAYVSLGVLVGASTFTYIVGTLSSLVEQLNEDSDTFRERMDHLKAYLRERGISPPLAARLRRYYEYYLLQRDDENEETILAELSDDLRSQLVLHLNRDVVSKISFFATQDDACVSYLMSILDPEFCTPGEYVFKEGQIGRHMYFLVTGTAEVVFKAGTSEEQVVATLLEGSYFGEIAMLTRSKRAASIRAKTYISLFVLSLPGLDRISTHYPEMANSILQEFRNKITHIKKTSVKQLGSLVQEDVKQARERSGLLAASTFSSSANGVGGSGSDLRATLGEFESILSRIVEIYGGGDRGKRKALGCVMQHLHKYEFSLDDFLQAAEEYNTVAPMPTPKPHPASAVLYAGTVLNSLQMRMRRRSSING
ncbi:Potassium voltage-gated channel sub H member 5 [Phytophthora boehmeriae]|uniref:Potassium voltage-gated channel sub H member 5 n=1 Tax=Phytophthora boehmeriae TaxID=109152 RepID=A0A8T1X9R0_9STRA|nr:Potassium voltage-gated channel sub H member 5 [Phytophthora boehmeriae]